MTKPNCTIKTQPPGAVLPYIVIIKRRGKKTIERHFKTETEANLEKHAWETGRKQ